MKVRDQNLVWATRAQTPAYALGDGTNSGSHQALVTQYIEEPIQNEVQHCCSEVYAWDVVNEPIDTTQSDCLEHGRSTRCWGLSTSTLPSKPPASTLLRAQSSS